MYSLTGIYMYHENMNKEPENIITPIKPWILYRQDEGE
jgi:hypothetical protein